MFTSSASGSGCEYHAKAPLSLEVDQGPQKRLSHRGASASRPSCTHKPPRDILRYPALMIRDPGFRDFVSSEARYQRGESARHNNFNSIGQVFLNNYTVGSAGMRMLSCH